MATLVNKLSQAETADPERAFERLFEAQYSQVVAIAYRILGDIQAAEDVAQDVFYAYHRQHAPDAPYAAAWLHKAAAHTAYNAAVSRARRERRDRADLDGRRWTQATEAGDPQAAVEAAEQRRAVGEALSRLPEPHAAVLLLRYSGLSYAEVAAALGVGVNQVGARLSRAEAALRKELTRDSSR